MISRRIILAVVAAGASAISIAGAVPAYAATVNVYAGTAPSGTTVAVQGAAGGSAGPPISLKDVTTGASGSCSSSTLTGTTRAGANPPSNFAQINGGAGYVGFTSCTTLGLPFTVTGVGFTTWTIAATGSTAAPYTPINITGINVAVDSSSCSFNVSGSVAGTLKNAFPSTITIPPTSTLSSKLVVSNLTLKSSATKCLGGAVTNTVPRNQISLSGTYVVTATNNAYNPLAAVSS